MRSLAFVLASSVVAVVACSGSPKAVAPKPTPKTIATPTSDGDLQAALQSIADGADGTVAVTVRNLSTGERASVHGDARLPMMSVFKLPLAVVMLSLVEKGEFDFAQRVEIMEGELRPGVSPLAEAWHKGDHAPTLETMLVRVLQDSDNTAGDKLVTMEGGGPAITTQLRTLGVLGVDVAEQEIQIFARTQCPGISAPFGEWTIPDIDACPAPTHEAALAAAKHEIAASPNGATTDALVELFAALDRGALLSKDSRAWLRDTLAGTKTGAHRLRAGIPEGTRLEHKTGTGGTIEGIDLATNDVGVITMPSGARVAIAVLTAGSHADDAAREKVIASLASATWTRFAAPR